MSTFDVADSVGPTPAAVRQLAARARVHVNARVPRVAVTPIQHDAAVRSFLATVTGGDLRTLIVGADTVVRFLQGLTTNLGKHQRIEMITVNGSSALGIYDSYGLTTAITARVNHLWSRPGGDALDRSDLVKLLDRMEADGLLVRKARSD